MALASFPLQVVGHHGARRRKQPPETCIALAQQKAVGDTIAQDSSIPLDSRPEGLGEFYLPQ